MQILAFGRSLIELVMHFLKQQSKYQVPELIALRPGRHPQVETSQIMR